MNWIKTEPRRLNPGKIVRQPGKGIVVRRFLSPYDVPDAIRAIAREGNQFHVQFRYMEEDEPHEVLDTVAFPSDGTVQLGRHSDRLYNLTVRSESPEDALVQAVGLISKVAQSKPTAAHKYDVAQRALAAAKQQLIESLFDEISAATQGPCGGVQS